MGCGTRPLASSPWIPLIKPAHYALGCAARKWESGDGDDVRNLLLLKPENPAGVHYRLGRLLSGSDPTKARHHVIEALLEGATRYGEAHDLLVELKGKNREPAHLWNASGLPAPGGGGARQSANPHPGRR